MELLIALAVSAIVLSAAIVLITQGLKSYQRQTMIAQLQEDAGIAMNQISDEIMEADLLNIDESSSGARNTKSFRLNDQFEYDYDEKSQNLTIKYGKPTPKKEGESETETDSYKEGILLCNHVTAFKVQIIKRCVNTTMGSHGAYITGINNPVQIKVTIEVSDSDLRRKVVRVTGIRNDLQDLTLANFNIKGFPDSDVLTTYQFLTDE